MYEQNGNISKEIENLKKKKSEILELRHTITETKNALKEFKAKTIQGRKDNVNKWCWEN